MGFEPAFIWSKQLGQQLRARSLLCFVDEHSFFSDVEVIVAVVVVVVVIVNVVVVNVVNVVVIIVVVNAVTVVATFAKSSQFMASCLKKVFLSVFADLCFMMAEIKFISAN